MIATLDPAKTGFFIPQKGIEPLKAFTIEDPEALSFTYVPAEALKKAIKLKLLRALAP